ncbi:hypothetical protein LL912_25760 [Niabella sp. CC-SYL272]|uniref:hypothetical protein n=1 Tax=Niabella agricola TaxID=2891571 RepID=UPI001F2C41F0|nr:hypothetical protein [Niabella agricola]MCF3112221.1 hypothetical protein [Niabella agricola]
MEQESIQRVINTNELFSNSFINAKVLYLMSLENYPARSLLASWMAVKHSDL